MLFNLIYNIIIVLFLIFLQNLFIGITNHALFISIVAIFSIVHSVTTKNYLTLITLYSFIFDIVFTDSFGLYFILFILISISFKFITENVLDIGHMSIFNISIVISLGVFLITLIHSIIFDKIINTNQDVSMIFFYSVLSIFIFFALKKILNLFENISNKLLNTDSKKHI